MGYSNKQTCPRCGRVLVGFQPCPNCTAGYAEPYQAHGQGVSSPTVGPRLVLLLGAIVLLSVLVFLIAPRGGSRNPSQPTVASGGDRSQESGDRGEVGGVATALPPKRATETGQSQIPAAQKVSRKGDADNVTVATAPQALPNPAEDEEFWRKKLERDLRSVGEYTPTAEEKAYWEQMRWQDHFSLSDQTRTSDYYLRRPELTGNSR